MYLLVQFYLSKLPLFFAAPPSGGQCYNDKTSTTFFGLTKWYRYLAYVPNNTSSRCEIQLSNNGLSSNYWLIGIAILESLFKIAGMVAIVFIIWGGFTYITSLGEPDKIVEARKTIVNALIGAAIAVMAVAIVSYVGKVLGG